MTITMTMTMTMTPASWRRIGSGASATVFSVAKRDVVPVALRAAIPATVCDDDRVAVKVIPEGASDADADAANAASVASVANAIDRHHDDTANHRPSSSTRRVPQARSSPTGGIVIPWGTARYRRRTHIVMPLAQEDLASLATRRGVSAVLNRAGRLRRLVADAARGLATLHAAGLVHGDVRPENVLVFPRGRGAIADWGSLRAAGAHVATWPRHWTSPPEHFARPALHAAALAAGDMRLPEGVGAGRKRGGHVRVGAAAPEADAYSLGISLLHLLGDAGASRLRDARPAEWKAVCALVEPDPRRRGTVADVAAACAEA